MGKLRGRHWLVSAGVLLSLSHCRAGAEGLALGPWEVQGGTYRASAPSRVLYFLTDQPYLTSEGIAEATAMVRRRIVGGGWGAAALLIGSEPQSFWTLSLVEGPDGAHYVELIEMYRGIHQAQNSGPTRLAPIEGAHGGTWEYGRPYRLRLMLTRDRIVGEVLEPGQTEPLAKLGWLLAGAAAVREGWAALREEGFEAQFAEVKVSAPPAPSPAPPPQAYPQGPRGCVGLFLGHDLPGAQRPPAVGPLSKALNDAGLGVARLAATDLVAPGALAYPNLRFLVADLRRVPVAALAPLVRWMQQGGVLVSLTAPAFGEFYWRDADRWLTWEEHSQHGLQSLGQQARPFVTWSAEEPARWQQGVGGKLTREAEVTVQAGQAPGDQAALQVTVPQFENGWWSLGRGLDLPPVQADERLTCFWAKGDEKTPELSLEWAEQDGSRWIAVVSLEPKWRYYVLPPQAFQYWLDNPSQGRGGSGDGLRMGQAVRMAWGLSSSHTSPVLATDAREHHLWLGPIALAPASPEALAQVAPAARPEMEALSPGYKLHEIKGATRWEATDLGRLWGLPARLPEVRAVGAVARPQGQGFDCGRWWRWVPLARARDAAGRDLGAPLSLVMSEMLPLPRCAWVSLGLLDLEDFGRPEIQQATAAVVARLGAGPVLFEGGATQFLCRPGEEIKLGARVVNLSGEPQPSDVRFRLTRTTGSEAALAVTLTATTPPRGLSVVRGTFQPLPEGEYRLTTELVKKGQVLDRTSQPLAVRAPLTAPPPETEVVRREGGRFLLGGKPWHPVGANYWPHNLGGMPGGAYWQGWLDSMLYEPELAEADLAQMESWGFTALAAVGADVTWASPDATMLRNLEDFLWRCQRHHIKVFFFVRGLDPRGRDDRVAEGLIRALRYHPALAGYDIAWEPGYWGARAQYTPHWRQWLERQYGSLEAAEQAFGYSLPRPAQGDMLIPPDEWCEQEGPWQGLVAAYRTYWNWQLGVEYRRSAALVRRLDPVHLVGFRGSNVTSPLNFKPVEQPAVLHFMDWAGPEGYDVPVYGKLTPWTQVSAKGLVTRTLSFLSGGKPVVWMEFGMPVYPNGTTWQDPMIFIQPERHAYQAEEGRRWWQMQLDSGAWGSFMWWYPGGFRVGENSDCGLVEPNNVPRPVAEMERKLLPAFAGSETRTADAWLDFRPEANPGGWIGEYLRLRDEYGRLVEQGHRVDVRTVAPTMTSADCPLVDPAGRPWPGKGPLRYLEAIFERVRLRAGTGEWREVDLPTAPTPVEVKLPAGQPVEIEAWAGNLAEARWLPAAAGVRLTVAGDAHAEAPLEAATAFQGSGHFAPVCVTDRLAGPLKLRLQLNAAGRAAFGEIVELAIVPQ